LGRERLQVNQELLEEDAEDAALPREIFFKVSGRYRCPIDSGGNNFV